MRPIRLLAAAALGLATALALLPAAPAVAERPAPPAPAPAPAVPGIPAPPALPTQASPQAVLATAERVLEGDAAVADPKPTIALLELREVLPRLSGADRAEARAILARPTEQWTGDAGGGYESPTERACGPEVCVHHVSAEDHPDDPDGTTAGQVAETLDVLAQVWSATVDRLGYLAPRSDRGRGGDNRLDVYLDHLPRRIYGYCVAEGRRRRAAGYCVLDNDYVGYANSPEVSLRATAAHEFFHAVQYAYDSYEDAWLMESTATWLEEQVFDAADDNRQYLPTGQLHRPGKSLDSGESPALYGNWIFWEHLTVRSGPGVVRDVWERAGAGGDMPNDHSVEALTRVLGGERALQRSFAAFAAANLDPASAYPEGSAYDRPRPQRRSRLGRDDRRASRGFRLDHLSSATWRVRPRASLDARRWRLRIDVAGPRRRTSPEVVVTVRRRDGRLVRERVRLDRSGAGRAQVRFGDAEVRDVSITAVNASTRYRCGRGLPYACGGRPRDDGRRFALSVAAVRTRR